MNLKLATLFFAVLCSAVSAVPVKFLAWDTQVAGMKISVVKSSNAELITDLNPLKRSRPFDVSGESVKLRLEGKANPDGTPADLELKLSGYTRPLVIVMPNDKVPSGLAGVVVNDTTENFKWGTYMVYNATKEDMYMVVNKVPNRLPVGWTPTKITPTSITGPSSIEIRSVKNPNVVLYSMVWQGGEDNRRLVIVIPSTDKRLGDIIPKIIPEDRRDEAVERAAAESERRNGGAAPAGGGAPPR